MARYIDARKFSSYGQSGKNRVCTSSSCPNIAPNGPIELEWQHLKKNELAGQMFDDELQLAYAVIDGVQARGETGNYSTQRVKFNSNSTR